MCKGPVETIEVEVYEVDPRNFTDFIDQIMPPPERFMDAMRQYARELEDEIIAGRHDWRYQKETKPMDKETFTKLWNGEWP